MRVLALLSSFYRNIFRRARVDRDLDDEVQAAFALLVDEHVAAGMTADCARRRATLELGRPHTLIEQVRSIRAGANTTIFTLLDAVLFKPLRVP